MGFECLSRCGSHDYTPMREFMAMVEGPPSDVDCGERRVLNELTSLRCLTEHKLLRDGSRATSLDRFEGQRCRFVESTWFQSAVGLAVLANTVVVGLETDMSWEGWGVIEQLFLLFFVLELLCRMLHRGARFFDPQDGIWWTLFDMFVVGLGLSELCILPLYARQRQTPAMALRGLRLLRLLRLLRVFRMFDYLQKFVDSLLDMLPTLIWIFVLLFLLCYVFAVVLTNCFGKQDVLVDQDITAEERDALTQHFGDVMTTLFSLFRILTMDSWHDIAKPIINNWPLWRMFFVFFIAFGSWTMISLLTAVVSDNMLAATADMKELEIKRAHDAKMEFLKWLHACFWAHDLDGNGKLDRDEFIRWAEDEATLKQLQRVGINMRNEELVALFDVFDVEDQQVLSIDEFVDGLARAQDPLSMKHMVMLEHMFKKVDRKVTQQSHEMRRRSATEQDLGMPSQFSQMLAQMQELGRQQQTIFQEQARLSTAVQDIQRFLTETLTPVAETARSPWTPRMPGRKSSSAA